MALMQEKSPGMAALAGTLEQIPGGQAARGLNGRDATKLLHWLETQFRERQSERRAWDLIWRLVEEFLNSNQHCHINPDTAAIEYYERTHWFQEMEVFDQLSPIYDARMGKLTRAQHTLACVPSSNERGDVFGARVSGRLATNFWQRKGMKKKLRLAVGLAEMRGTAFLGPRWDTLAGRAMGLLRLPTEEKGPRTDEPRADDDRTPTARTINVREGDAACDVIPPEHVFPDSPWRNDIDECRSIILAYAVHVRDIYDAYGVTVEPEDVSTIELKPIRGGGGALERTAQFRTSDRKLKEHAIVKVHMERRSGPYPEGRYIVWANGKLLRYDEKLPYVVGEDGESRAYNLVRLVSIVRPGCLWGKTVYERLIPTQRRYNAVKNRRAEYLARIALGMWMKPEGSCEDESLQQGPGGICTYSPVGNHEPHLVVFPPLPSDFEKEERSCVDEFTIISGVSELARYSNAPPGVKAGVALSIADEQDNTRLAPTLENISTAVMEAGRQILLLYKQFVREQRLLREIGQDKTAEVLYWQASDIRADNIRIEAASATAESPAQRKQTAYDLLQEGIYANPDTKQLDRVGRNKFLQDLGWGTWEEGVDDEEIRQRDKIAREEINLRRGVVVIPREFDDGMLHVRSHNGYRLTAEYEALCSGPRGQMVEQAFEWHVRLHMQMMLIQSQKLSGLFGSTALPPELTAAGQGGSPAIPGFGQGSAGMRPVAGPQGGVGGSAV